MNGSVITDIMLIILLPWQNLQVVTINKNSMFFKGNPAHVPPWKIISIFKNAVKPGVQKWTSVTFHSPLDPPHFQPMWKNPLHQPARFCQTSWWGPYLTPLLQDEPKSQQSIKAAQRKRVFVCVCARARACGRVSVCAWRVLTRQIAAGDFQKPSDCSFFISIRDLVDFVWIFLMMFFDCCCWFWPQEGRRIILETSVARPLSADSPRACVIKTGFL